MPTLVSANLWFGARGNGARVGPYESGGVLYGAFLDTANATLEVWKSADAGLTWTEADAANHVTVSSDYTAQCYACDIVGDVLYIAHYTTAAAPYHLRVAKFALSTGLWAGGITSALTSAAQAPGGTMFQGLYIACRGPNNFVVSYINYATDPEVRWGAYSGSWASGVVSDAEATYGYYPQPIVQGSSGVQIFYLAVPVSPNDGEVRCRVLDSGNSLGSMIVASGAIGGIASALEDYAGAPYSTSGALIAPAIMPPPPGPSAIRPLAVMSGAEGGAFTIAQPLGTIAAPDILAGNQASFADFDNLDPLVQKMVWMPDVGDYATQIQQATRNRLSGLWSTPSLVVDVSPNRLTDVFVRRNRVFYGLAGPTYIYCVPSRATAAYFIDPPTDGGDAVLSLSCGSPPGGTVGVPYAHGLAYSGGTAPYTFALLSGSLPPGLTLGTSTGSITGTPTTAGTYSFTVQLTDSLANAASVTCSITIVASGITPFAANCGSPPGGVAGVAYTHTMFATGGTPPYGWAIVGGALPPGLTLDPDAGTISGTPTLEGSYPFIVRVTDDDDNALEFTCSITIVATAATVTCTLTVVAPESGDVAIACGSPPTGTVGTPYSHGLAITSPSGYTVAVTAGALPGGLTVASTTGVISGTPYESGVFSATFTLTHESDTATVTCTFRIYAPGTLRINCDSPEDGTVGVAYAHQLGLAGGRPDYTVEITSGSLPTGLTMSSAGAISGTPSAAGTSTFTARVTDADSTTATVTCSIGIDEPNEQGGSDGVCESDEQGGPG